MVSAADPLWPYSRFSRPRRRRNTKQKLCRVGHLEQETWNDDILKSSLSIYVALWFVIYFLVGFVNSSPEVTFLIALPV
jgi:hypothetical protein